MKKVFCLTISFLILQTLIHSQNFITEKNEAGAFPIVTSWQTIGIYVDENDDWLVHKAAALLQNDIEMVTGKKPAIVTAISSSEKNLIIIGTVGKSKLIAELAGEKELNVDSLKGKWESFLIQSIHSSNETNSKSLLQGVRGLLVIAGSDKRGTAYGVFELSEQIGVSPWYWWADVPVKKKKEIFIRKGGYKFGPPSVKYR